MKESQAKSAAEAARGGAGVPPHASLTWVKQRYIELAEGGAPPGPSVALRDVLVWIAHFHMGNMWVELAIDDATGKVVRVERSRGASRAVEVAGGTL